MRLPYGPKPDSPVRFTFGFVLVMLAIPTLTVLLFVIDPEGPLLVALLALLMLAALFTGIGFVMSRRGLSRLPKRNVPR